MWGFLFVSLRKVLRGAVKNKLCQIWSRSSAFYFVCYLSAAACVFLPQASLSTRPCLMLSQNHRTHARWIQQCLHMFTSLSSWCSTSLFLLLVIWVSQRSAWYSSVTVKASVWWGQSEWHTAEFGGFPEDKHSIPIEMNRKRECCISLLVQCNVLLIKVKLYLILNIGKHLP